MRGRGRGRCPQVDAPPGPFLPRRAGPGAARARLARPGPPEPTCPGGTRALLPCPASEIPSNPPPPPAGVCEANEPDGSEGSPARSRGGCAPSPCRIPGFGFCCSSPACCGCAPFFELARRPPLASVSGCRRQIRSHNTSLNRACQHLIKIARKIPAGANDSRFLWTFLGSFNNGTLRKIIAISMVAVLTTLWRLVVPPVRQTYSKGGLFSAKAELHSKKKGKKKKR